MPSDPYSELLAIVGADHDLPEGVYRIALEDMLMLPNGDAVDRYAILEAPGRIYEEVQRAGQDDRRSAGGPGA